MGLYIVSLLVTAIISVLLGSFVFLHGRHKLPNIFLALLSLSISGWCFGQYMGEVVATKAAVLFWTRVNIGSAVLIPVFYLNFILAFIDRIKAEQRLLRWAYGLAAILLAFDCTSYFVADVSPRLGYRYYPEPGIVYPLFALFLLVLFFLGFAKLSRFTRDHPGSNQAKYVVAASLVCFLGGITAFSPVFNLNLPVVSHYALPLYLAIMVYTIVKHKLLDINLVIREGLVYSLLTVVFAGIYALVIILANRIFQGLTQMNEYTATVVVVFASVIIFQPLRNRIQGWVDRLFFKGSYYYQKTINDLSAENLKLYRSLLQADKLSALGTVAAGMAHEIKNPLASIKGLTQVMPENIADTEFLHKYTEIVPRQLDRINRIVEDLLDFGHPAKMAMEEVDLAKELDGVLRLVENQCRQANIAIVREFSAVPAIIGNGEKLSQAFMNVILNAIQSMPSGGQLRLGISQLPTPDSRLIVKISDTGPGITSGDLPNIFDPFYTTKEGGTGMGLAVTYRIIKEHHGQIEVESEVGKGTTFKICLPIKSEPSA